MKKKKHYQHVVTIADMNLVITTTWFRADIEIGEIKGNVVGSATVRVPRRIRRDRESGEMSLK